MREAGVEKAQMAGPFVEVPAADPEKKDVFVVRLPSLNQNPKPQYLFFPFKVCPPSYDEFVKQETSTQSDVTPSTPPPQYKNAAATA